MTTLSLFAIIFVLNSLPAFAPPTWMLVSAMALSRPDANPWLTALVAATAATAGRLALAKLAFILVRQRWLSTRTKANVDLVKDRLERRRAMTFGALIKKQPECQPDKAERSGKQERRLPAKGQLQPDNQWRRDDRADADTAVENAHPDSALANGKPIGDDAGRARPITGFAYAEDKAKRAQADDPPCERVGAGGDRPDENRNREATARSNAIVNLARNPLANRIGDQKPRGQSSELEIRQMKLRGNYRRKN